MGLLDIFKRKKIRVEQESDVEANSVEARHMNLYILAENNRPGIIDYIRSEDKEITFFTSDIEGMENKLLRTVTDTRLIIIDFGFGVMTRHVNREKLVGLVEACSLEEREVTIFTHDKTLGYEFKSANSKAVIKKYTGIEDVVTELKKYNEVYKRGELESEDTEANLQRVGKKVEPIQSKIRNNYDLELKQSLTNESSEKQDSLDIGFNHKGKI